MFDLNIFVLVVDDMPSIRKILIRTMSSIGFKNFLEASNGDEALKIIKTKNPPVGLIMSDWNMPVCSGLDFLKKMKSDSEIGAIPFIMVTSESDKAQVVEAIRAGVNGYVLKPFTPEDILARLQDAYKRFN